MILISHQRSGSEWFLHGLHDIKYGKWEILGDLDRIVGTNFTQFNIIPMSARLAMLRTCPPNKAHKIHFSNLLARRENPQEWDSIIEVLQARNDVYLLTRRNVRRTLISFMIARFNNLNFHQSSALLTSSFTIDRDYLEKWYHLLHTAADEICPLFTFKEEFILEDLLDGSQVPQTLKWSADHSTIKERGSVNFVHLITNYEEVVGWMDEMQIPGTL